MDDFSYRGARALILLHQEQMKRFVETWKKAKASGIVLPETDDRDYASLETLLRHLLTCARRYMVWICEKLELPDPEIRLVPEIEKIEKEGDPYLIHLLHRWEAPLAGVEEKRFFVPTYTSWWNVEYCVEAMLEHAVMHPIRHAFQLQGLMRSE